MPPHLALQKLLVALSLRLDLMYTPGWSETPFVAKDDLEILVLLFLS